MTGGTVAVGGTVGIKVSVGIGVGWETVGRKEGVGAEPA